jgi:hypothetical protein
VVILLAAVAAVANAVASVLQRLGVEGASGSSGVRVMAYALRRPVWFVGLVVMIGGFAAQATALHLGALGTVQPILVGELVIVVAILAVGFGVRVGAREVAGAVAATVGLAGFLVLASPVAGTRHPSHLQWAVVAGASAVVVAGLLGLARRRVGWRAALALGSAASVGFALTAAITKAMTDDLVSGWERLFTSWPLYALAIVGLWSFVVMQRAFRAGPFVASQSTLILVNPFISIVVGVVLFGDRLATTRVAVGGQVASLVVMTVGALVLCASPLVRDVRDEGADHAPLARPRRPPEMA